MKIQKIYNEKGVDYVDVRHDIVLEHIYKRKALVLETDRGIMSLSPEELKNPYILSDRTFPYKYTEGKTGNKYVLFSYPLNVEKVGLGVKELAQMGVF